MTNGRQGEQSKCATSDDLHVQDVGVKDTLPRQWQPLALLAVHRKGMWVGS